MAECVCRKALDGPKRSDTQERNDLSLRNAATLYTRSHTDFPTREESDLDWSIHAGLFRVTGKNLCDAEYMLVSVSPRMQCSSALVLALRNTSTDMNGRKSIVGVVGRFRTLLEQGFSIGQPSLRTAHRREAFRIAYNIPWGARESTPVQRDSMCTSPQFCKGSCVAFHPQYTPARNKQTFLRT